MKQLILVLSFLAVCVAPGWADNPVHTIASGIIKSINWADQQKETSSELIVKNLADGKVVHVLLTATTTLWDSQAKAIMPEKILVHGRIKVIYFSTPEGVNIARSIKLLK